MAGLLGLSPLFGAIRSLIPAQGALRETVKLLDHTGNAYETLTATANGFYQSVIGSNLELQQQIRQSTVVLASQLDVYDAAGNKIDDFTGRFDAIGPKIKNIQKEIELSTRDIVGATDTLTNSILNQTINQFSTLQGQTKEFANELEAIPTLVAGLTSAFTTFQIPEYQVPQEIRSLLQGDLNNPDSQLAKQLQSVGLTKEAFEQAKAMGEGLDFLNEKLSQFVQANASGADTIENSFSIIKDVYEQTFRSIGEDPTEGLRKGLTNVVAIINNPEVEERIKSIATSFGGPIGDAIEQTFQKVTTYLSEIIAYMDENFDLDEMARQWGQLFGDLVSIAADVAVGVITAFGAIGAALSDVLNMVNLAIDGWTRLRQLIVLGDLSANLDIKMDTEAAQKGLDDFQDSLDSKGPLRKLIDFAVNVSFLGILSDRNNKEVEKAIEQANEVFRQDFERTAGYQEYLIDISTKIRDTDTSEIDNFTVDLKADLGSQITALEDTIDFSELDEKATTQIKGVLESITSATDFDQAQAEIQRIIRASAVGGEDVLQMYQGKLALVQQTIDDAIARRDELTDLANNNDVTAKEREELTKLTVAIEKQKELRREISVALDPQIAKQQEVIDELEAEGKSTEEAIKKLDELIEKRKEAGDPTEITGKRALDLGASLTKVYSDLNTAIDAYREKIAKTTPQVAEDFERMSAALEMALKFGATTVEEAINLLNNAITDTSLPVEQRVAAQEQLVALIEAELGLINSTLEIEQERNNLLVQRGAIEEETSAVLNNEVEQRKVAQQIAAAQEKLEANRLLTQTGAKEAIEEQLVTLRKQLETAEEQEKAAISAQIAKQEELLNQTELSTQEQKELELEIESLQVQQESLRLQANELKVDEALADIAEKRQKAEQEINTTIAKRNLEIAKARQGGALKVDVEFQRQEGAIEDTRAKLIANEEEILNRVNALEQIRKELAAEGVDLELSKAKQLELQNELVSLQTEGLNLQAQLIEQNLAREETILQNAINKQQQIAQLKSDTVDAEYALEEAALKVAQSIQDSVNASRELEQSIMAVKETALSIEIADLRLKLSGIDKLDGLKEKLDGLAPNTKEFDAVQQAINKTNEMYDISAKKRINLSKLFEKVNLSSVTQAELDNIQQAIDYNQQLAAEKGSSLNEQLELLDQITQKELEQSEMMMNNQLAAIEADAQAKQLSLEISDLEIQKELEKLEIKRLQLEIEKDIIDAKVKSGEISQEDGEKIKANIDKQASAYDKIETSLNSQSQTNKDIAKNIGEIAENNKKIVKSKAEQEQRNIVIANEEDKIQRYTSAAADEANRFSQNQAAGAQNTGSAADEANRLATNMRNASISANSAYGQANGQIDTSTGSSVRMPNGTIRRTPGEISTIDLDTGVQTVYDSGGNVTRTRRVSGDPSKIRRIGEGVRQPGSFQSTLFEVDTRAQDTEIARLKKAQNALLGLDENGRGGPGSGPYGSIGQREIDALQSPRYKEFTKQILQQENLKEAIFQEAQSKWQNEVNSLANNYKDRKSTPKTKVKTYEPAKSSSTSSFKTTEDQPLTDAQVITEALKEIGRLSQLTQTPQVVSEINSLNKKITDILSSAQNDPQIKAAQNRLTTLLAMPKGTQEQNAEIAELLKFIDAATEAQKEAAEAEEVTATTLLEAINSGAFQAGAFTPETDTVILQNPETGEIVIGGTRLDEAQLDMLLEVQNTNSILKDIRYNTSPTTTKEALQSSTPMPTSVDSKTPQEDFVINNSAVIDGGVETTPQIPIEMASPLLNKEQWGRFTDAVENSAVRRGGGKIFGGNMVLPKQYIAGITPESVRDDGGLFYGTSPGRNLVKNPYTGQFQTAQEVALAIKAGGPIDADVPVTPFTGEISPVRAEEGINILNRTIVGNRVEKDYEKLNYFGKLTPEQLKYFIEADTIDKLPTSGEKLDILQKAVRPGGALQGVNTPEQINLLRFREELAATTSESEQFSIYNKYGFQTRAEGQNAIVGLAPLQDFIENFKNQQGGTMPNLQVLKQEVRDVLQPIVSGIAPPSAINAASYSPESGEFLINPYTGNVEPAGQVGNLTPEQIKLRDDITSGRVAPTPVKKEFTPLQAGKALNYLQKEGWGSDRLQTKLSQFGLLTPKQSEYFTDLATLNNSFKMKDSRTQLGILQKSIAPGGALESIVSPAQLNLLKFRSELNNAGRRYGESAKLDVYEKYGFSSRQEGDAAIANLAPLEDFIGLFKQQKSKMPDLNALKLHVQNTLSPIANGVDAIAVALNLPSTYSLQRGTLTPRLPIVSGNNGAVTNTLTTVISPNGPISTQGPNSKQRAMDIYNDQMANRPAMPTAPSKTVNNYYPDNSGSINSILREAGL